MASSRPNLKEALARTAASKTAGLRSSVASERAAALAAAQAEVQQAGETDRWHRQRDAQECEQHVQATLAELADRAEEQRRACAAAVLAEAFESKSGGLRALIDQWRSEPTRLLTNAILLRWRELDRQCQAEVGMPLSDHVLATCFIDSIVAIDPSALLHLASHNYGANDSAVSALGHFTRAATPGDAQSALETLENVLLSVARRGAGQEVSEWQRKYHELRRSSATRGDLIAAQSVLGEQQRAAEQARFAASYVPPSNRERPVPLPGQESGGGWSETVWGWLSS
jgi:hypothetical protein